ncbi:MAG: glycosyltransferase [Chloroflexi bacterium]|nr:glycosyltransferase [Chloroflexota bacterium]
MKIVLIAPTYLPSRRANTIQTMKMAQAFTALGHTVQVVVPQNRADHQPASWDDLAQHYGLQQRFAVDWLPVNPRFRSYDYGFKAVQYARRQKADLIFTRLPQAAAIASSLGMDTIFEIHDLPRGTLAPWLLRRFLSGNGARRLVVITESLREAITQAIVTLPEAPFTLIAPDGVDLARYADLLDPPDARAQLSLPQRFTVGYTGHLYAGRGGEMLLKLAKQLPEINFLLVGGIQDDVTRLRDAAAELGNLTLTGFVPNAELPLYQAACDALLMPYQRRVAASSGGDIARYLSPMKLFEYLACGRVILSSDLPVLREILNENNALLLPPDDVNVWAEALRALAADPALRDKLATQSRRDAQQYDWNIRAALILANL